MCNNHPNYLGDFGYLREHDIYFISGAYSVDFRQRIPGISWWSEEELSDKSFTTICKEIQEIKPATIISHDGPESIVKEIFACTRYIKNQTSTRLEKVFNIHQPKQWIFGHHHRSKQAIVNNTLFICLTELEMIKI